MQAKLAPGQRFEEFVERPRPPGQHDDHVGIHEHDLLALVHRLGDDIGVEIALADLARDEVHGNDAEGAPTRGLGGLGDKSHETDVARAVDETPAVAREHRPGRRGIAGIGGRAARARAAIDADGAGRCRHGADSLLSWRWAFSDFDPL